MASSAVAEYGPESVLIDLDHDLSTVTLSADGSSTTAKVAGIVAFQSTCDGPLCSINITLIRTQTDEFTFKDRLVSGLMVSNHGPINAAPAGNGTYSIPAESRFDVFGAIDGDEKGLNSETAAVALAAYDGRRFAASLGLTSDKGASMMLT